MKSANAVKTYRKSTIVIEPAKLYCCQEGTSGRASTCFGKVSSYT